MKLSRNPKTKISYILQLENQYWKFARLVWNFPITKILLFWLLKDIFFENDQFCLECCLIYSNSENFTYGDNENNEKQHNLENVYCGNKPRAGKNLTNSTIRAVPFVCKGKIFVIRVKYTNLDTESWFIKFSYSQFAYGMFDERESLKMSISIIIRE